MARIVIHNHMPARDAAMLQLKRDEPNLKVYQLQFSGSKPHFQQIKDAYEELVRKHPGFHSVANIGENERSVELLIRTY